MTDQVNTDVNLLDVVEMTGDEPDFVVKREGNPGRRHRVVTVAPKVERDHPKPRRKTLDERGPLRFGAQ